MNRFISIDPNGGIGNQMFQIANAISLARELGCRVILPERSDSAVRISNRFTHYVPNYYTNLKVIRKKSLEFDEILTMGFDFIDIRDNIRKRFEDGVSIIKLDGYFQSEKNFYESGRNIKNHFRIFKKLHQEKAFNYFDNNNLDYKKTVGVHVRRGDYLGLQANHFVLGLNYYKAAFSNFDRDYRFLVFSDDIEWCIENFNKEGLGDNFKFTFINESNPYISMITYSICLHHIIANSTFSWWGAWLGEQEKTVNISPDPENKWFGPANRHLNTKDLIPNRWKRI